MHVEQQQTVFVKNNKFMEIASGNSKEEFFSLLTKSKLIFWYRDFLGRCEKLHR